jgi:hypothetical protein
MDIVRFFIGELIVLVMVIPITEIIWKRVPSYRQYMRVLWMALGAVPGSWLIVGAIESNRAVDQLAALAGIMLGQTLLYFLYGMYASWRHVEH